MILLITLKILLPQTTIASTVNAAPLDFSSRPTTTDAEPSYVPDPRGRGTFGLLLSSIITLTLCVYTSIHLNITPDNYMFRITVPAFRIRKMPEDEPQTTNKKNEFGIERATVYKFYWVLIALFAPEVVLFASFIQWLEARTLCSKLRKIDMGERNPQPEEPQTESSELLLDASKLDVLKLLRPTIPASTDAKNWSGITLRSAFFVVIGGFAYRRGRHFRIPESDLKFPNLMLNARGFLSLAEAKVLHPGI
jgi:hypothetical protein